uniref:Uncharacterized protein n=1 Tax=Arundo donax TaxID=35708 RepID=A0A0A8ZGW4_ARUDO
MFVSCPKIPYVILLCYVWITQIRNSLACSRKKVWITFRR